MTRDQQILRFDSRLIERNLRDGKLSHEDLAKHLEELEDSAHNAEWITVERTNDARHTRFDDSYDDE